MKRQGQETRLYDEKTGQVTSQRLRKGEKSSTIFCHIGEGLNIFCFAPKDLCFFFLLSFNLFIFYFILFNFTILYWFFHISKRICHRYTCVPNPEPSSLLPPPTIPLGHPSAPAPSIQYRALNLDW